jgi:hypothetical protein
MAEWMILNVVVESTGEKGVYLIPFFDVLAQFLGRSII